MRIGSREVNQSSGIKRASQASVGAEAFGAGVGRAVQGLGTSLQDMVSLTVQIQERNRKAFTDVEYLRLEGEEARRLAALRGNAQPGAAGVTKATLDTTQKSFEDFSSRVKLSPEQKREYEERFERFRQGQGNSSFAFEFEEGNRFLEEQITEVADQARTSVYEAPELFAEKLEELEKIVDSSALPPIQKEALKDKLYDQLVRSAFLKENELAATNNEPIGPIDGRNPVAPNLAPYHRGLLNAAAGPESGGRYNVRYAPGGGTTFDSYDDHPRIFEQGPHGPSSAAGRYQITATTWDSALRQMRAAGHNIDGKFTPVNQDRVAVFIAQQWYAANSSTGRTLDDVLQEAAKTGNRELLREVYSTFAGSGNKTLWAAFQNPKGFDAFANRVLGTQGVAGGGTPDNAPPDVFNDPRFAALSFEDKIALSSAAQETVLAQQRQKNAEQEAREAATETRIRQMLAQGTAGMSLEVDRAIALGQVTNPERIARMLGLASEERKEINNTSRATAAIVNGEILTGPEGRDMLDSYYKRSGLAQAVQDNDEQGAAALGQILQQTNALPPAALAALFSKLNDIDPGSQAYGMTALSELYRSNPAALGAILSQEQLEKAATMASVFEFNTSPQAAVAELRRMNDPATAELRQRISKQADDILADMDASDFVTKMTSWTERNIASLFGPGPKAPLRLEENLLFMNDYQQIFKRQLVEHLGDENKAHAATAKIVGNVYAPNPLTGEFMKYSPYSPAMGLIRGGEAPDWITEQIYQRADIPEGTPIAIVSTPDTIRSLRETGKPSYIIFQQDGEGNPLGVPVQLERLPSMDAINLQKADEESLRQRREDLKRQINNQGLPSFTNTGASSYPWKVTRGESLDKLKEDLAEVEAQLEVKKAPPPPPKPTPALTEQQAKEAKIAQLNAEIKRLQTDRSKEGRARLREAGEELRLLVRR